LGYSFPSQTSSAEIPAEYAENGSLESVMKSVKRMSIQHLWNATGKCIINSGIVLGMKCVHSRKTMHRDLKPGNILINGEGRARIGDFGSSCLYDDQATLTPDAGTVHYAPEVFREEDQYEQS
jgi:mitogen-activated protein kinase kinase